MPWPPQLNVNGQDTGVYDGSMTTPTTSDTNQFPSPDELRRKREERNRLENEIAEFSARIDAAIYELLVRIRRFGELGGWSGATSYPQWLSWRANLAPGTAREYVRVAHALASLPKTSDALRRGQVSYSKVRAITRVATPATEDRLLHLARQATAADLERIVRAWRFCDRQHEGREDRERRRNHGLSIYPDVDGMFVVRGLLTPEVGAVVRRAIEAASEQLYQEAKNAEPRNPGGGGRHPRFRGNVAAACLRRRQGGDASRRRRQRP